MRPSELVTLLRQGPLLADGGMGTALVEHGIQPGACFEALNVERPHVVASVHQSFVEAGARVVLANTFGANRFKLAARGLADRVAELNLAGARIARDFGTLVAGSIGPLGVHLAPLGRVQPEEAADAYAEQIRALADAEVDLLVIETQSSLVEVEQAVAAARSVCELAVIVTMAFTRDDRTLLGATPAQVAEHLAALGVDALGVNCGQGPAQAVRLVGEVRALAGATPLVAKPNAGGPERSGGRLLYPATPGYFAEHVRALLGEGVAIVGGCCGIGPAHIAESAPVLRAPSSIPSRVREPEPGEPAAAAASAPVSTQLGGKLASRRFVVAVELDPPRGFATGRIVAAAQTLSDAGADVIDVADSPLARMRMSPWAACVLIREQVGLETTLHFPTRGRNLIRLQRDLLAVHALGIRNVFVCMGDPVAIGEYPQASDAVDVTPTGLISLVTRGFNQGRDMAGASIGEPTAFLVGCAVNPGAPDLEAECRLLKRKVEAGAGFALTQPVFTLEAIAQLRETYAQVHGTLDLPILVGVLPLMGSQHAEFIHNEVPGISVPDDVRELLLKAGGRGQEEGSRLAVDLVRAAREEAAGVYLMPQLGRFDLAAEIVDEASGDS